MATVTKPVNLTDGTVPTAANFNDNFDTLYNEFNGSISNENIATDAAIASSKLADTISGKTFKGSKQTVKANSDGATVTFDLSEGNIHTVTLGGNRTLALSNAAAGSVFLIRLLQDGTGSRTVTWFSTIKWAGGSAPTLTTTASKADMFGFVCTSSGNYDGFIVGQNL